MMNLLKQAGAGVCKKKNNTHTHTHTHSRRVFVCGCVSNLLLISTRGKLALLLSALLVKPIIIQTCWLRFKNTNTTMLAILCADIQSLNLNLLSIRMSHCTLFFRSPLSVRIMLPLIFNVWLGTTHSYCWHELHLEQHFHHSGRRGSGRVDTTAEICIRHRTSVITAGKLDATARMDPRNTGDCSRLLCSLLSIRSQSRQI
jgi:hypothetical protein